MSDFSRPYLLQFKGSSLARALLELFGWKIEFEGLPTLQGVAAFYPHTSNWDVPILFLTKWAVGVQVVFWAKDTLFRIPLLGAWLRWLGGIPVLRTVSLGMAGQMIEQMKAHKARGEYYWLGLSPEGTRKYIPGLRSGFYRVATAVDVPLLIVTLDYARREVKLTQCIKLTGNEAHDLARISSAMGTVQGLKPENMAPVVLLDKDVARSETIVK